MLWTWPSRLDEGWEIRMFADTLASAQKAYREQITKPRGAWTFTVHYVG